MRQCQTAPAASAGATQGHPWAATAPAGRHGPPMRQGRWFDPRGAAPRKNRTRSLRKRKQAGNAVPGSSLWASTVLDCSTAVRSLWLAHNLQRVGTIFLASNRRWLPRCQAAGTLPEFLLDRCPAAHARAPAPEATGSTRRSPQALRVGQNIN
jgi:hypothetical protein